MFHLDLLREIKLFSKEINTGKNVDYFELSVNPAALHLLHKNIDKVVWSNLETNLNYKKFDTLIKRNPNFSYFHISWYSIDTRRASETPSDVYLLEEYPNKIEWKRLSKNPAAMELLEKNLDKINWSNLSENPAATWKVRENFQGYWKIKLNDLILLTK